MNKLICRLLLHLAYSAGDFTVNESRQTKLCRKT